MNYLLMIMIALSQIIVLPGVSFRWIKEYLIQLIIITVISSLIWKKNKWISLFVLWCLLLFLIDKSYVINDVGQSVQYTVNLLAFFNIINIVLYGLFYYVLHQLNLNKKLIYKTFCFVAMSQVFYIFMQKLNLDQFFYHISSYYTPSHKTVSWCVGSWANESLVAWCIVLCSPFFLAFKELRYKIGYVLSFIALLFTQVTAGIIGFVLGFLFWLWFKSRKIAISLLLLCSVVGVMGYSFGKLNYYLEDTHRFKVWKKAIEIWATGSGKIDKLDKRTITGYGLGSFRVLFNQRSPEFQDDGHWAQAHNEYLQVLFEQGIIGIGIILCLMWTTFYSFFKSKKGLIPITSLVICAFISIVGFPFRTAMGIIPIFSLVLFERSLWEEEVT